MTLILSWLMLPARFPFTGPLVEWFGPLMAPVGALADRRLASVALVTEEKH